jgi:hypothetical protein
MKVDMRDVMWWRSFFRYTITTLIYLFVIASVFFYFTGDWSFLYSFQYYITTFTTTFFAMFLRFLWVDKGETVALKTERDIKVKEDAKRKLIKEVVESNRVDELETYVINETRVEKEREYKKLLDRKVLHLKKGSHRRFHAKRYNKWVERRKVFTEYLGGITNDFNLDNVKVAHYKITIDDILSVSHIQQSKDKRKRYNKKRNVFSSYQTNVITFVGSAVVGGASVFLSKFQLEDLIILFSQIMIFTLNIYSGYSLGLNGILQDYSTNLSDDYVLLKRFLKEES